MIQNFPKIKGQPADRFRTVELCFLCMYVILIFVDIVLCGVLYVGKYKFRVHN